MATDVSNHAAYRPKLTLKSLGSTSPVFPGFDIDISTRIEDRDKPDAVWHRERARQMMKAHPELKELIGQTPSTAIWCLVFAVLQVTVAMLLANQPWWLVTIVAYVIGAWINTNLFFLGHECNHGLVFKKMSWNRWLYSITTAPMCMTAHHTWWIDHAVHHNDLGSNKDFLTRRRTQFLATRHISPLVFPWALAMIVLQCVRSALGLVLYLSSALTGRVTPGHNTLCVLAEEHLISGYRRASLVSWAVVYPTVCLLMLAGLYWYGGWMPILYLVLSAAFLSGFAHPWAFGLILGNAHFHGHRNYQPTSSYYGWLNRLTFNHGLHLEHHDMAGIPWNHLPKLRKIAPEFYDEMNQIKSYVALAWTFHFGGQDAQETLFDNENHRNAEKFAKTS